MKMLLFLVMCVFILVWVCVQVLCCFSMCLYSIDVIVLVYNEVFCLECLLISLLQNFYVVWVICVNDGFMDNIVQVFDVLQVYWFGCLVVVYQVNMGKGGVLMYGLQYVIVEQVFLIDVDIYIDLCGYGLGYLLDEIECGVDVVGGVFLFSLQGVGFLLYVWVSLKLLMIIIKCSFQQWLGGVLFIVFGLCGLFCILVLCKVGFFDCICVEDLDMFWLLVVQGYCVCQSVCCVVYLQECNMLVEEWWCWWCWIVGYVVCMCLYCGLLLICFGLFSILLMMLFVFVGIVLILQVWFGVVQLYGLGGFVLLVMLLFWIGIVMLLVVISVIYYCWVWLVFVVVFLMLYVLFVYVIWLMYGVVGLFIGCELLCDKLIRYLYVVE